MKKTEKREETPEQASSLSINRRGGAPFHTHHLALKFHYLLCSSLSLSPILPMRGDSHLFVVELG